MRSSLFQSSDVDGIVKKSDASHNCVTVQSVKSKNALLIAKGALWLAELNDKIYNAIPEMEEIHFRTEGKVSLHQIVETILQYTGPADMFLATWAMTEEPLRTLYRLKANGNIKNLNCLFHYKIKDYHPDSFYFINSFTLVALAKCHAKATVIVGEQISCTVIGSANWTMNPRTEAGAIFFNPTVAQFHKKWILDDIEKNTTNS